MGTPYRLVIFDLDGTLYEFPANATNFKTTKIYGEIKSNAIKFIGLRIGVGKEAASAIWDTINAKYNGHIATGIETEYHIPRGEYLSKVWDVKAETYLKPNLKIKALLAAISKKAILSSAPKVWVDSALKALEIDKMFDYVATGSENSRKPHQAAYLKILSHFDLPPKAAIMIDDDLEFLKGAKDVGIDTVLISKRLEALPPFVDYKVSNILELRKLLL
ncbi:MAG: HAD-IA family hydrolase [Candidatus Micrarchaeota archaeon]|nr:HAD-IA family hydrolase [Candidatus Micrarchaeota archaeon]